MFLTILLSIWAAMHAYVFWRLGSVPWVAAHFSHRSLVLTALALWLSYPLARILEAWRWDWVALPLEFVSATWIGVLFLLISALLAADFLTLGGWLMPSVAPMLGGWAVIGAGILALIALVQGLRPPIVKEEELPMRGLPPQRDGVVLVAISDLHLGTLLGHRWLAKLVQRVRRLKPDVIVVVGDLVDGNAARVQPLVPLLRELRAPLGVWAVTGNHEYYAGLEQSVQVFDSAGYLLLRDRWAEVVPGLVLAGVDDLTARRQFGLDDNPMARALAHRPAGATILLSHSPMEAEAAAAAGVGLMLSGHTHNGQLWPFTYLVRLRYRWLGGRYKIGAMTLIVCRGTGTWGPRMRLWRPGEIRRITLRACD